MRLRDLHALALVVALAATACAGDTTTGAPTETASVVADAGDPTEPPVVADPSPTPEVTSVDVPLDLPRKVVLGGLRTTVLGVRVSNATPATALDDRPEPGGATWAYLDTVVDWKDGYAGGSVQVEVGWYALALADGTVVPAERVGFVGSHAMRDGQPAEVLLAFLVEDAAALTGASLRVGAAGQEPATLPLDGPEPLDPWPVPLEVTGTADASITGGCEDGIATTTLLAGEVDLDGGTDHTDGRIVLNGIARAQLGHVFVRLRVQTVAQTGSCGGAIVDESQYRLLVDGRPTAPLNRHAEKLDPGAGTELVFGWMVPRGVPLDLQVGTAEGPTATFEVPVPDLP